MKFQIMLLTVMVASGSASAQYPAPTTTVAPGAPAPVAQPIQPPPQQQQSAMIKECEAQEQKFIKAREAVEMSKNDPQGYSKAQADLAKFNVDPKAQQCQSLSKLALVAGNPMKDAPEMKATSDGRIVCVKKAGYTLDFDACSKALGMYNMISISLQGLTLSEGLQAQQQNAEQQKILAEQAVAGNAQQAALDAAAAQNRQMKAMNQMRASAYVTAVGALSTAIGKWPKGGHAGVESACQSNKKDNAETNDKFLEKPTDIKCKRVAVLAMEIKNEVFANDAAKTALTMAAMEFMKEGIKAGIVASQFDTVAQQLEQAAAEQPVDGSYVSDPCIMDPMNPLCNSGTSTPVATDFGFGGNDFSIGSAGSNAFDMGDGEHTGDMGDPVNLTPKESVAGVASPFADEAKAANGILNPAAAASMGGGGAAAGAGAGGGGGGGMGGGGGSASLGDETQAADANPTKEAEIKAKKLSGNYGASGATGFAGVKGGSEENPLASLFDNKSGGGIEEDRSIASGGDIDGKGSELFQKISKKYGQVQADKRIEANNLE